MSATSLSRVPGVAASTLVLLLSAAPATAAEPGASLPDIEDEVMCTICGTPLELSASPQAERERELIRRLIDQGLSKPEIKDALVAEYGPEVLAIPDDEGFDLTAWLLPPAILVLVGGAIAAGLWRRRSDAREAGEGGAAPLAPAEAQRLDRDLTAYDR